MATQSASRSEGVVGIADATPTNKGENNPRPASKMKSGWNWASENPRARLWWHNHAGRSIHPRFVQDLLRILDSLQLPLIGETADPRQQRSLMLGHSVWYLRLSPASGCPTSTGLFPRDLFLVGQLLKSRSLPKYSDDGVNLRLIPPAHTSHTRWRPTALCRTMPIMPMLNSVNVTSVVAMTSVFL